MRPPMNGATTEPISLSGGSALSSVLLRAQAAAAARVLGKG